MKSLRGSPSDTHMVPSGRGYIAAPAPEPAFPPPSDDEPFDWRRFVAAVWRFRWLVVTIVAVGSAAGFVVSRYVRPGYTVQATIWIDSQDGRDGHQSAMTPIQPARLLDPEAWVDLLQSYVVLDSVVRQQHLYLSFRQRADTGFVPGFALADTFHTGDYTLAIGATGRTWALRGDDGTELERGAVGDSVGRSLGFLWAPNPQFLTAGRNISFSVMTPRDAARQLGKSLVVHIDPEGNILRLELDGTSPDRMAAVVNSIAAHYVAVAATLKRQKLSEVTAILGQQLQGAQASLNSAEAALQSFGVRTATLPRAPVDAPSAAGVGGGADQGTLPAADKYFALTARRDELHQEQATIQRALAAAGTGDVSADALGSLPTTGHTGALGRALADLATREDSLRALRYRYSDNYPAVAQLLGEVNTLRQQTIPGLARQFSGELDAQQRDLAGQISGAAATLRGIPPRTIEEARLRRGVQLAEDLYSGLAQKYDEARLAEVSTVPDVRVLDPAVASRVPTRDSTLRILALAFGGSVALALALAAMLDRADPRVRYPTEVSRGMGLSILGAVPHLRSGPRANGRPVPSESTEMVIEALRGIRLNLLYSIRPGEPLVLAISSPGAGEGKSFLTANLGLTFAEAGQRTLVIDGDLRRGLLHRRFGLQRRPGLAELLRGSGAMEMLVQRTSYPRLDLLACGSRAQNAPELLGGAAMTQLIGKAAAGYSVVLIDTPPLGACVDPYVLGTAAGCLALVIRTGVSERELTMAKLEALGRLPVRVLGVVLNDVPAGGAYRSYGYHISGYEAIEEGHSRVGSML